VFEDVSHAIRHRFSAPSRALQKLNSALGLTLDGHDSRRNAPAKKRFFESWPDPFATEADATDACIPSLVRLNPDRQKRRLAR
jgi:hypothetical protein